MPVGMNICYFFGEYSIATEDCGSWFTNAWLKRMKEEVCQDSDSADWYAIFNGVAEDLSGEQHPIVMIAE